MIELTLQAVPNQTLSFSAGDVSYDVTIKTADSAIADISMGGEIVITGIRILPYRPIVPYEYLTRGNGNLFFITENGDAVDYEKFGINQTLVFLNADEVDFLNAY